MMAISASKLVLPMVIINIGGEMMNVLHQRLNAQNIEEEKATLVLQDVIRTMYAPKFIEELFKPQDMYSDKATKAILHKLAHSSIMRLNESSMDKLFDLVTMGFKYQVITCAQPQQLLQVTLNHLEVVKRMVPFAGILSLIDTVIETTIATYRYLDTFGWVQLKQGLLEFFQGRRVKYNVQLLDGTLVLETRGKMPIGAERPGIIRYFGSNESKVKVVSLPMASAENVQGVLTSYIDFDSPMGTNIYEASPKSALDPGSSGIRTPVAEEAAHALAEAAKWNPDVSRRNRLAASTRREMGDEQETTNATAGLKLLASLLGASVKEETKGGGGDAGGGVGVKGQGGSTDSFRINLVPDDSFDAAQAKNDEKVNTIAIDLASSHMGCAKMLQELDLTDDKDFDDISDLKKGVDDPPSGEGSVVAGGGAGGDVNFDDLLDLMDSAADSK